MSRPIVIGILEDDPDMRGYLRTILEQQDAFTVAFACETIAKAQAALSRIGGKVDLCLVDLQLPDGNGADFVRDLRKDTNSKALILTVLGDKVSVLAALEAGADGYLLKDTPPDQIIRHIHDTIKGVNPISPQAATHLLKIFKDAPAPAKTLEIASTLTEREQDILTMFAKGLSYKEAASALGISPHTVSDYVKSIYTKLSVHSRNEAVFEALQLGWIDI